MAHAQRSEDAEPEARKIPNSGDVRKHVDRILKLEEELDQCKADLKGAYDTASDEGIDRKALKIVVKHRKHPMSFEVRQEVNELQSKLGDLPLFAAVSQ